MIKVYICPKCGWVRAVSRRKEVECHKCGEQQMSLTKLTYDKYAAWDEKEREEYATRWIYIHDRIKDSK